MAPGPSDLGKEPALGDGRERELDWLAVQLELDHHHELVVLARVFALLDVIAAIADYVAVVDQASGDTGHLDVVEVVHDMDAGVDATVADAPDLGVLPVTALVSAAQMGFVHFSSRQPLDERDA